jgi:hypothetical protein
MTERFDDHERFPHLSSREVQALADIAYEYGEQHEANHVEIQNPHLPPPFFYRLTIPPLEIDASWRMRVGDDSEVITGIVIEYNDPMVILDDDRLMDAWVTVSVTTKAYDAGLDKAIDRHIRYRFSLTPGGVCEVVEGQSDENKRAGIVVDDLEDALPILAQEARPLNEDDLQFLRLLISRR